MALAKFFKPGFLRNFPRWLFLHFFFFFFLSEANIFFIDYPYERNDTDSIFNWHGSCNDTGNDFKLKKWKYRNTYKMRMKVHVCTDEEVASGKCKRCDYMECYYAG